MRRLRVVSTLPERQPRNHSRLRTHASRRRIFSQKAPASKDLDVLVSTSHHRLEDVAWDFAERRGDFPTCPWWQGVGRCDGRDNRAGRVRLRGLAEASDQVPSVSALRDLSSCFISTRSRLARRGCRISGWVRSRTRGVEGAARQPCRHRGFDRDHVGTWHRVRRVELITDQQTLDVQHLVFLSPELPRSGGGGGGGGNQQSGPIRRAQGVGAETITLRVRKQPAPTAPVTTASPPAVENVLPLPSIVLDAKPLASGLFDQIGLPTGVVMSGTSTGSGSGGGVGTGIGTGIGRDVGLGSAPDPAAEPAAASTASAGRYPRRA